MWKCFICGNDTVFWDTDLDTQDLGICVEGIVSYFRCSECGADYEVLRISENEEE
jgi:DNA-directed RNA polymerase subunit RPC12/RpoP